MTRQIPGLRVFVEGVVIVVSILLAFGIDANVAEAQARSDSLAVIAASLERFGGGFLANDAPELVLAAARLLPPGMVGRAGSAETFCDGETALAGDNVGSIVSVSLTPGDGPRADPRQPLDSVVRVPTEPIDHTGEEGDLWLPAFYVDDEIAYVSLSSSCWMSGVDGGGGMARRLDDGRPVRSFFLGVTYELQRDVAGWIVTSGLNLLIS